MAMNNILILALVIFVFSAIGLVLILWCINEFIEIHHHWKKSEKAITVSVIRTV